MIASSRESDQIQDLAEVGDGRHGFVRWSGRSAHGRGLVAEFARGSDEVRVVVHEEAFRRLEPDDGSCSLEDAGSGFAQPSSSETANVSK